jgi:hypothetical protein
MTPSKSERHYVGRSYSFTVDVLFGMSAIITLIATVFSGRASMENPIVLIATAPIFCGFIISLTYMGGLIYEIKGGKLLIKSGLLRIPIKSIPISNFIDVTVSDYNVFQSMAWGWHNKFAGGVKGYVRGFKGGAVLVNCKNDKCLLASDDPENMKMKIEEYLGNNDR